MPSDQPSPRQPNENANLFEALFRTYYSGLIVYATRMTGDTATAEDIVYDVFASVWEKQEMLHDKNLKSYLFSSVRNRALNHLRHLKIRDAYQEETLQRGEVSGTLTWDYYVESELRERIEEAVAKLPPQCRKIFTMNRFDNKSIPDIAAELQLSPRTVETQISIALKRLRVELADYLSIALVAVLLHL